MKILLVHNYYGSSAPSGENRVFAAEKTLLEKHGHAVAVYTRHSDEIRTGGAIRRMWGKIKGALCTVGNPFAAHEVAKVCRAFKPDIVHFHNTFPLISPLAIRAAHRSGAKVVMTLHNYRTVCAAGVPTRNGKVCTECFRRSAHSAQGKKGTLSVWPAIRHRCYRGSLFATLPLALNIRLYRKSWAKWVDQFVVLSEFQKTVMEGCGFPAEKISVKGNFVPAGRVGGRVDKKEQILYVGRLSDEKGIGTLLRAWRMLAGQARETFPQKLVLVGDGEGRGECERLSEGLPVEFAGQKPHEEVVRLMAESRAVVLPSECWETFGLTVVEGMRAGTPPVVSNLGALPDIMSSDCGEVFEAGNAESLAAAIIRILSRPDYVEVCKTVRREAEAKYSEEANYGRLMEIYAGMLA